MKIDNVKVYGLLESVVASGLPMVDEYDDNAIGKMTFDEHQKHFGRAGKLSVFPSGEGHHNFLCGIIVQMNVTAPRYWWPELQRYHFVDIVSATSTMHRLKNFVKKMLAIEEQVKWDERNELANNHFSRDVNPIIIDTFMRLAYSQKDNIEVLKANLPEGFLQTARLSTNYRQLKTIYHQRKNHQLSEWREFCEWIETLPHSEWITNGGEK